MDLKLTEDLTKRQRREVRELAVVAHERELRAALSPLAAAFAEWQAGTRDTWDLLEAIDALRPARKTLSSRYEQSGMLPLFVASAIAMGLLTENEVTPELRDALAPAIALRRRGP